MQSPRFYQELVEQRILALRLPETPGDLYDPIRYMLSLGGKRIRPVLLLMASEMFDGDVEQAMPAALGIEVFHNFTLLHDDIMDKAPLRRNKATVHERWNQDVAILSGDTMFVMACQLFLKTKADVLNPLLHRFFATATEVCEGQQLDMNFEKLSSVSIEEYIQMITLKTAVLLGHSLEAGAMIAGAEEVSVRNMYSFGQNLGIAFQLHDDVLDLYGDAQKFGKQVGGDILSGKKTFLMIKALEIADDGERKQLMRWLEDKNAHAETKVNAVKEIFEKLEIRTRAEEATEYFFNKALDAFDQIPVKAGRKEALLDIAGKLMVRES